MSPRAYRLGERAPRVEETRRQILGAALKLFPARGVHGVSIEAVANAAGVSRGIVYHHFGSKQGLLDAMNLYLMHDARLDRVWAAAQHEDAVTGLREFLKETCRFHSKTASAIHIGRYLALTDADARKSFEASYIRARKLFLSGLVARLADEGHLHPEWSREDAVEALMVLTSAESFDSLVRYAKRSLTEGAALLSRMATVFLTDRSPAEPERQPAHG